MSDILAHNALFPEALMVAVLLLGVIYLVGYRVRTLSLLLAVLFALFLVWLIATAPVPWDTHTDRDHYALSLEWAREYHDSLYWAVRRPDPVWHVVEFLCSRVMTYRGWFLVLAVVYVGCYFWSAMRLSKTAAAAMFISFVGGFAFYSYGINGLRTGIAVALIILGYSFITDWRRLTLCCLAAICCHLSALIPIACLLLGRYLSRVAPRKSLLIVSALWIVICLGSYLLGRPGEPLDRLITNLLSHSGRLEYLVNPEILATFNNPYNTGFRLDFILFSLLGPAVSFVYLYVGRYRSPFYVGCVISYLLANAFWLLVIRLPFTDRFAYLSWFLLPILLIYPLTDHRLRLPHRRFILPLALLAQVLLFTHL